VRIRSLQDFLAGLIFLAFGIVGLWIGRGYQMGSASHMGPGYFPVLLSGGLLLLGAAVAARSFVVEGQPIEAIGWRPVLCIAGAVFAFGATIERFGLVVAVCAVTLLMAVATEERRWPEVIASAVVMSLFCIGIFVFGLGEPLKIWVF